MNSHSKHSSLLPSFHPKKTTSWSPKHTSFTQSAKIGRSAENLVIWYLKSHGWTLRERNYETHKGEIDIIAQKMNADLSGFPTVAFIEVKARSNAHGLPPQLNVTIAKQKKITATIRQWIGAHPREKNVYRCDIAALVLQRGKSPKIQYFPSAFCAHEPFGW